MKCIREKRGDSSRSRGGREEERGSGCGGGLERGRTNRGNGRRSVDGERGDD